jgi:hypothetical protein
MPTTLPGSTPGTVPTPATVPVTVTPKPTEAPSVKPVAKPIIPAPVIPVPAPAAPVPVPAPVPVAPKKQPIKPVIPTAVVPKPIVPAPVPAPKPITPPTPAPKPITPLPPKPVPESAPAPAPVKPQQQPSSLCPSDMYLYGQSDGGFCCPVPPTGMINGEYTVCPQQSGICALSMKKQGQPLCSTAKVCPGNMYLYGETAGGFCCPVPPSGLVNGEYTTCPQPTGICALDNTMAQGLPVCNTPQACPPGRYLYGQTAGGFCCPVPPSGYSNGEYTTCPQPLEVCALNSSTSQGLPLCSDSVITNTCSGTCNNTLVAPNGKCKAAVTPDAKLGVYNSANQAIWVTNTGGQGVGPYKTVVQPDGNYVLYDSKMTPLWSTNTQGQGVGPYKAVMQNDCNLVLYDSTMKPLWAWKNFP